MYNTHIHKFIPKCEQRWRKRGKEGGKEEKNIAIQGMKYQKNRIETWLRTLGALSTSRLGSPCRHLRDVMWGNSWSLFSYLVCSLTTFAFRERGNLSHLPRDFPLLLFSFPFPYSFLFLIILIVRSKTTFSYHLASDHYFSLNTSFNGRPFADLKFIISLAVNIAGRLFHLRSKLEQCGRQEHLLWKGKEFKRIQWKRALYGNSFYANGFFFLWYYL